MRSFGVHSSDFSFIGYSCKTVVFKGYCAGDGVGGDCMFVLLPTGSTVMVSVLDSGSKPDVC